MLKQVLQQNASKAVAKSKQSQRQIQKRASRLWSVGADETSHHVVQYLTREPGDGMMR